MKNGSTKEFMQVDTVAAGEVYVSPTINALAIQKFADRERLPEGVRSLNRSRTGRIALIAGEQGVGRIAEKLCISRTTVETHCEHIKLKLGYHDAKALKRGAHKLLGTA